MPEKNLKGGSSQTDIIIENSRISEIVDNMIDIIQKKQIPKVKFRLFKMKIMQSMLFYANYDIRFAIWKQSTYTFILIG